MNAVAINENVSPITKWNPRKDAVGREITYIDIGSVSQDSKQITNENRMLGSEAPSRARQIISQGDILVSTVRPNLNAVALVPEHLDGATASTGFCVLRPIQDRLDNRYLFHWVKAPKFVASMTGQATGQSYPAVSDKIVKSSEIPLPPLEDQKHIAAILDQADKLRRLRQTAITKLNTLGQSIFYEMFLKENGAWEVQPLSALGKVITGATPPTSNPEHFSGRIPFVTPGDLESGEEIKRYVSELGASKSRTVKPGATFVCCIGTVGKMDQARDEAAFNQQINAVQWGDSVEPNYGFYALQNKRDEIIHRGRGASTTLPILKKSEFQKICIAVPPKPIQQAFSDRVSKIQVNLSRQKSYTEDLYRLFTSLQYRAFRGEL